MEISEALVKKLRRAVHNDGNHEIDCHYWTEEGPGKRKECNCWFELAKKEIYGKS